MTTIFLLGLVMGGTPDADAQAALALAKAARERTVQAAPAVAATTFRNGSYHAGHSCPSCGRTQFVIESGRKGGTHTHRCAADGTVWFH